MIVRLSAREEQVLGMVSRGLTNKEIAIVLSISPCTVKIHVRSGLKRLGLKRRSEDGAALCKLREQGAEA
jgi:DNA-binding CsgD family transcriptional regulator